MRRTNDAGDLFSVFEDDERGPQFHAERAAERAAGAVFDFEVRERAVCERFGDRGLGALAIAAPVGAEFEDERAGAGVDLGARGLLDGVGLGHAEMLARERGRVIAGFVARGAPWIFVSSACEALRRGSQRRATNMEQGQIRRLSPLRAHNEALRIARVFLEQQSSRFVDAEAEARPALSTTKIGKVAVQWTVMFHESSDQIIMDPGHIIVNVDLLSESASFFITL